MGFLLLNMDGWIKLHRKLSDNPIWFCEKFTRGQAWVDLILLANHQDSYFYKRGVKVNVKRGQVGRSEVELSDRWKWSRSKVRKFLKDLEKEQQIEQQKTNVTQLISIINYDNYQQKEQQTEQQKDTKRTPKEHQKDTYKNVKKEKNVNNDKEKINIPTYSDFKNFAFLKNSNLDELSVKLKYESWVENGWKDGNNKAIKNWKSKLLNTIPYLKEKQISDQFQHGNLTNFSKPN